MISVTFYYDKKTGKLQYFHDLSISSWPYSFLTHDYLRYPPRNLGSKDKITLSGRNLMKCLIRAIKEHYMFLLYRSIRYQYPMSSYYLRKQMIEDLANYVYLKSPNSVEWIKQYADK